MDLSTISNKTISTDSGIWKTPKTVHISYTENGHELIKDKEENSFWFSHRLRCLSKVIENFPPKMILDIGGGNGQFSKYIQSKNIETVLLEPGFDGAMNAHKSGIKNVINGPLIDADFKSSSIDTISLLDVLEHIENDHEFLLEIHRILVSGGKLILTVPAYQSLYSDFDKEVGHFRRYTLKRLNKALINCGFKIEYKSYLFSFIPIPLIIGRFFINRFKRKENRKSTGHAKKNGLISLILGPILWVERGFVMRKIKIPFGSSCLIVASKIKYND